MLPILLLMVAASQSTSAQTFTVLYRFSGRADGAFPYASLIRDTMGNLYGTTSAGGAFNLGTVFRIGTNSETVLYNFKGGRDGALPYAGLVRDMAGNLYGTTAAGGSPNCAFGCGTVFKLDHRNDEIVLYTFSGGSDGANPYADLLRDPAGNLYGTAQYGGEFSCLLGGSGCGIVFKLDKHGHGDETVLYSFNGSGDGAVPHAGLVRDTVGTLYGTASLGGADFCTAGLGCGTVFKLRENGDLTVLHVFAGSPDAALPQAGLVEDGAGNFYGTTSSGGSSGHGTVFKVDQRGNETVLYNFKGGRDGAFPYSGLVRDTAGSLYGTTSGGGILDCALGCGTVFKADKRGIETVLYSFTGGADGAFPYAGLIRDAAGNLYGTTLRGGQGYGVVFKLAP